MHLLIPFASSLAEAGTHTLRDLNLPNLARLLGRLAPGERRGTDEYSFTPPHEGALAAAWGWAGADGALPFAAHSAATDGVEVIDLAWGALTPVHWHVGTDQVTLTDPLALELGEDASRALFESARELFESEGFAFAWGAPLRWYAAHESLVELPCASLDRVVGRTVDLWMLPQHQARLVRRLQNEVQMLWYQHPVNEAREANGQLPVNSFWLSGCGRWQPADTGSVTVDDRLRLPLLAQDWAAWADAWRALDAGPLAQLRSAAERGEAIALTLCGERLAQRFEAVPQTLWQRVASNWRTADLAAVLESL
jgi:hypothetical protein